jgi:hypothetical protein
LLFISTAALYADDPLRICIYGDNRGSNKVHRAILRQAKVVDPRLFIINGDVLKFDYGSQGTPDAVLQDYRTVFSSRENPLTMWPAAPGPAVFVAPGGHDEQYFVPADLAAAADKSKGKRYSFEGTSEYGTQLYDAFNLEQMRILVQPLSDISEPLPMSRYGDYLLTVGVGPRRDCAIMILYRTDRWSFHPDQVDWVDSTLSEVRRKTPMIPILMVAHDWLWLYPDSLDDGHIDGASNGVREGSAEADRQQKQRLFRLMQQYRVDLAVASDSHAYWAQMDSTMLKVNCAAAICTDPRGQQVAADNVWLEYVQTAGELKIIAHTIEPPIGCGMTPTAAAFGTAFEKTRTKAAVWHTITP